MGKKMKFRRYTDRIRLLADELWDAGYKEVAQTLHIVAAEEEARRREAGPKKKTEVPSRPYFSGRPTSEERDRDPERHG
jgi:hypothetical protein